MLLLWSKSIAIPNAFYYHDAPMELTDYYDERLSIKLLLLWSMLKTKATTIDFLHIMNSVGVLS